MFQRFTAPDQGNATSRGATLEDETKTCYCDLFPVTESMALAPTGKVQSTPRS